MGVLRIWEEVGWVSGYRAYPYWCPVLGGPAVRLSMVDERGGEYFAVVSKPKSGREWRDKRKLVLQMVENAVACGLGPGEVWEASDETEEREGEGDEGYGEAH